jgi:hypothetical protein
LSYTSLLFHWLHHFLIVPLYTEMYFMLHSFCVFDHFTYDPLLSHCVPQGISIMELDAFSKSTHYWCTHSICCLKYLFCAVLIINVFFCNKSCLKPYIFHVGFLFFLMIH